MINYFVKLPSLILNLLRNLDRFIVNNDKTAKNNIQVRYKFYLYTLINKHILNAEFVSAVFKNTERYYLKYLIQTENTGILKRS